MQNVFRSIPLFQRLFFVLCLGIDCLDGNTTSLDRSSSFDFLITSSISISISIILIFFFSFFFEFAGFPPFCTTYCMGAGIITAIRQFSQYMARAVPVLTGGRARGAAMDGRPRSAEVSNGSNSSCTAAITQHVRTRP